MNLHPIKQAVPFERERFPFRVTNVNLQRNGFLVWAHWHEELEFIKIIHGTVLIIIDNKHFIAEKNDIIFINSSQVHTVKIHSGYNHHIKGIMFDKFFLTNILEGFETKHIYTLFTNMNPPNNLYSTSHPLWPLLNEWMMTAYEEYTIQDSCYDMVVKACIYRMVAAILRDYKKNYLSEEHLIGIEGHFMRIRPALQYIDKHFVKPIYLQDVCALVNMSPSYFSRFFKRVVGMTMSQYITSIRIQMAKKLLLERKLSVTEIAEKTGYYDIHYFGKVFKEATGISPLQFRNDIDS